MIKYHISKKNYIGRVFIAILIAISIAFAIFVIALSFGEEGVFVLDGIKFFLFLVFGFFVPLALGLIFGWLIMRKHVFYDEGENFVIEKGLINKRLIKIPYQNINMIAIKRNLFDLVINTAKVEVDTDTTVSPLPEGRLMLEKEYAYYLKGFLENKKDDKKLILQDPNNFKEIIKKEEKVIYQAKSSEIFLFGLLRPGFLAIVIIAFICFTSVMQIIYFSDEYNETVIITILITFLVLLLTLSLIALAFGLGTLLSFYDYKLKIKDGYVEYEYGFFKKQSFRFNIKRINALYLKQSIGLRFYKKYNLEATITGIGEFNNQNQNKNEGFESKCILPVSSYDKTLEVLKLLNAEQLMINEFTGPTRLRKINFIILPLIIPSLMFLFTTIVILIIGIKYFIVLLNVLIIYFITVLALIKRLNNHGYNTDDDLMIKSGSYTITRILIKRNKIQQISFNQNLIQLFLKLGNINVRYKKIYGNKKLLGYTKEEFKEIKQIV